jgi:hypothetical protein
MGLRSVLILAVVLVATSIASAAPPTATVADYVKWTEVERAAYVAGAVDMLLGVFSADRLEVAYMCTANMGYEKIFDLVGRYLATHSVAWNTPPSLVVMIVVTSACGGGEIFKKTH